MSALTRTLCLLTWLHALSSLAACTRDARDLELIVVDDRGEALAEVALHADGDTVGRSDAEGKLRLPSSHWQQGATLQAECPEAYRAARPQRVEARAKGPLQFVCRPKLRTLAVVAHAPGAVGALLRADGQPLGRVAADGTFHAVLRRAPGASFQLTLEAQPALTRRVQVRDRDEIVLLDAEP